MHDDRGVYPVILLRNYINFQGNSRDRGFWGVALKTTKSGAIFGTRSEVCISEPRLLQLLALGDVFHTHCELKNNTSSHKTVGAYRSIFQGRCLVFCIVFVVLSLVCIVFLNLCPIPESPQKT